MNFANTNGARIYYETAGSGPPFVMIHAGVADSRQWNNEFAWLADAFRALRYDMRGYGRSEPVAGDFRHIDDLCAVMDQAGIDSPAVVMGCSMGGGLAMDFTLANPSRVRALIMVGSGPSGLKLDVPVPDKFAEAEAAFKAGDMERLAEIEAQIWFDGMGRTPEQVNPVMRSLALDMNRIALANEARELGKRLPDADTPAAGRLGELTVPVQVIVGEHDIPYMLGAADVMADNIVGARKVVMQDAAHLANMDHPDVFRQVLSEFLTSLD